MKLIDLLVKELPKRGGWPANISYIAQDEESATWGFRYKPEKDSDDEWMDCSDSGYEIRIGYIGDADDCNTSVVTREQYESALAESQKPAWNGEGVPPVGCECECHVDEGIIHCVVVGYDFDGKAVVMRNVPARKYFSIQANSGRIKPLRTEAERKRDAAAEAIDWYMPECTPDTPNEFYHAKKIYDAIAAGKIPGVKLED